MNVGKAILRVLRVFGIIILIPVVLVLLALLIGFITDLSVTPQWKQAQQESLEYFNRIKSQRYSSGVSFAALDANAWDFYDRAVKQIADLSAEDKKAIGTLTKEGEPFDLPTAERLVQTYAPTFALVDSGTLCKYCAIPWEYEKGYNMPLPSFIQIQNLARLALIKGRLEMARGNSKGAAETYAGVLKMGADIGGGGEVLIARMVGIVVGQTALKQIARDLDQFDLGSVLLLEDVLGRLEGNWPSPLASMESEYRLLFLPSVTGWNGIGLFAAVGNPRPGFAGKAQAYGVMTALSWRHFFSVRRALLEGTRTGLELTQADRELKDKPWSEVRPRLLRTDSLLEKGRQRWDIISLSIPNYTRMSRRYWEFISAARVLKVGLTLRENHWLPRKEPEAVLILDAYRDRTNGQPLHRIPAPSGKGIHLYSVGLNLVDDAGEGSWVGERAKDQEKDDIWIEVH
jgi:hypothetical protein